MQAAQLWKLFEKTGNIGVYMLYKQLSAEGSSVAGKEAQRENADPNTWNRDKRN